jgi:hypothetical protein
MITTPITSDSELDNLFRSRSNPYIDLIEINDVSESELLELKEKIKLIEKNIKINNKPKTITISGKIHNKIKKYCNDLGLSIGDWCEETLLKEMDKSCVMYDDYDEAEIITKNWLAEKNRTKRLIKYNKHIISDEFRFVGYSVIDGYLIYEYIGDDIVYTMLINNFDNLGVEISNAKEDEIGNIKNNDFETFLILKNKTL